MRNIKRLLLLHIVLQGFDDSLCFGFIQFRVTFRRRLHSPTNKSQNCPASPYNISPHPIIGYAKIEKKPNSTTFLPKISTVKAYVQETFYSAIDEPVHRTASDKDKPAEYCLKIQLSPPATPERKKVPCAIPRHRTNT